MFDHLFQMPQTVTLMKAQISVVRPRGNRQEKRHVLTSRMPHHLLYALLAALKDCGAYEKNPA